MLISVDPDPRISLIDPVGYLEFLLATAGRRATVTDSGGVQEETTHLGVSCFTLRDNTERPVTAVRPLGPQPAFWGLDVQGLAMADLPAPRTRRASPRAAWMPGRRRAAMRAAEVLVTEALSTEALPTST